MERPVRSHVRASGTTPGFLAAFVLLVVLGLLAVLAAGPASAIAADAPATDRQGTNANVNVTAGHDGANVTVYASGATFGDAAAVEAAIADGSLEPAAELVIGNTLVVAVDSPRLAETMAEGNGSTTARFLDALDGDAEFRIVQTNPSPNTNRKAASVGRENLTVHRNGTMTYALVETDELAFRYRSVDRSTRVYGGERFAVELGHHLPDISRGGYEPAGPVVELHPFRAEFVTNGYWYEPLPPEWVELSVNVEVEPAKSLVARVTLWDGRTITRPVGPAEESGPNRVWTDLRDVEPGTAYALELVHDGEVVERYNGTVREPRATLSDATITEVEGGTAVDVTVSTSHGGKVQVLDESCDVVGTKWVEPGVDRRVTVELWNDDGERISRSVAEDGVLVRVARHRGASDALYRAPDPRATVGSDGGYCPASDRPSTPTTTPTPTVTSRVSPTASTPSTTPPPATKGTDPADGTRTTDDVSDRATTAPDGPGFAVPTALLVLVGLVLAWTRRR